MKTTPATRLRRLYHTLGVMCFTLATGAVGATADGTPVSPANPARVSFVPLNRVRLLAPFRAQAGLPAKAKRYGGWESRGVGGQALGHYLTALSHLHASTGSTEARQRIDYIVGELAACQRANGDGYVLPVGKDVFTRLAAGQIKVSIGHLNDAWVPFYMLHKVLAGLRDAHRLAGNPDALPVARGIAGWLDPILRNLTPAQIQEMLRCEHGGMNEVLADLSADTGDPRYLRMASAWFHHAEVLDPMYRGEDRLDGKHGNRVIASVVGLAREYELASDARYHAAATSFWRHVACERSYVIGGSTEHEYFFPPAQFPQKLSTRTCETCNTYNMLKLTRHLFEWEPDAAQMDFVERALINHLLSSIGQKPGEFSYFLGLESVAFKAFSTPLDAWWCCVGTGLENPAKYGEQIYAQSNPPAGAPPALWINHYIASSLDWAEAGVRLRQETQYPDSDTILIKIATADSKPRRFALKLRHPWWCAAPEIKIAGRAESVASAPSSYIALEREWNDGDTIELRLPMALRSEEVPHSGGKIVALMFGPSVLAAVIPDAPGFNSPAKRRLATKQNSARRKTDSFPPLVVAENIAGALARLRPVAGRFGEFRAAGVLKPGGYENLALIPLRRVYEEQYAVYFPLLTPAEWGVRETEISVANKTRQKIEAATLDSVDPGNQQSEIDHNLREKNSSPGDILDRQYSKYRNALARAAGWFSYEMAVAPNAPVTLQATYWSGVRRKGSFDIFINDRLLATQPLEYQGKHDDFYDVSYAIPPEWTRGKTKVTVRFAATRGAPVGELVHLRTIRAQ